MSPGVVKMPLSFNIIKGLEGSRDCRTLQIRHQFMKEEALEPGVNCPEPPPAPEVDPALVARQIIAEAEEKAEKLISGAREAAGEIEENILREALEEAERIKKEAREEAFEQGKREALAKAAADASSIRDQARSVLRQCEEIRRQTLESVESEIVRLSIEIAEKVLSAKLSLHPQVVVEVAREAINMLHDRDRVVLFVNPSEAELFEDRRDELAKHLSPMGELHIIEDSDIKPGGCVAETEHGRVDARLDGRWEALLKALEDSGR